jgi:HK97 gp10 family phage protein
MSDKFISCEVTGLDQIQRALEKLAGPQAKKAMKAALQAGAKVSTAAIVAEAPKDTGFLAEHIGAKFSVKGAGDQGAAYIGPKGHVDYPNEGGGYTKKTNRKGKSYLSGRISATAVARFHEYGTKFQPATMFISRAFRASWPAALDKMIESFKKTLGL